MVDVFRKIKKMASNWVPASSPPFPASASSPGVEIEGPCGHTAQPLLCTHRDLHQQMLHPDLFLYLSCPASPMSPASGQGPCHCLVALREDAQLSQHGRGL